VTPFEVFKKEIYYWIEYFGLKEYEVYVEKSAEKDSDAISTAQIQHEASIVMITMYSEFFKERMPFFYIRRYAFHEVAEVLLSTVADLITNKEKMKKEREATHRIIGRLENTLFVDSYKRRFKRIPKAEEHS